LLDIYVPESGTPHPHLRLRRRGDTFEITKKTPVTVGDASIQTEVTIKLEPEEFNALSVSSNKKVSKIRHNVNIGGYEAEVDIFQDELAGLVLIDFEFASQSEKESFKTPEVCLADVTQEPFLAGGLLAGKSYQDIKPELDRLGYLKIDK
jgi:CYTH domain-containing protein